MKTIVRKDNNVSLYLYDDEIVVDIQSDKTIVGDPPMLIIGDCNSSNATLFENVSNPEAWQGWKYLYTDADGWVVNPEWIPPETTNAA